MIEQSKSNVSVVKSRRTPTEGYITQFWGLPEYTDWVDESMSWKTDCYIGDWSFLWERRFKGSDAKNFLAYMSVNDYERFPIGRAKHLIQCNQNGKIIQEGIVAKLGEEEYMTFGQSSLWADYLFRQGSYNATSEEEDYYNLQVAGPSSLFVIEKAANEPLRDIKYMWFRYTTINGRRVMLLRQNMAGELGYELVGPIAERDEIYNAVLEAGQEFGIRRLGGRTVMINHLESWVPTIGKDYIAAIFDDNPLINGYREELRMKVPALLTWHNKIAGSFESNDIRDWYRSPVEFNWVKEISFTHDFIGREALEAEVANPKRVGVTLVWNADDVVDVYASLFRQGEPYQFMDMPIHSQWYMWADKVLDKGKLVGVTTSRGYSYYLRHMLSICTIDPAYSKPGTEVTIIWGNPGVPQKEIRATVAPAPIKKDNRRMDVTTLPSYLKK